MAGPGIQVRATWDQKSSPSGPEWTRRLSPEQSGQSSLAVRLGLATGGFRERLEGLASEQQVRSKMLLGLDLELPSAPKCWKGLLRSSLCIKKAVGDRSKVAKALKKLARATSAASFFRKSFSTQVEFGMRVKLLL